jgi:hypothetical protein
VAANETARLATDVDEKTAEVALALFDHLDDQINRTDTKAQVVLATDALLLGWFSTQHLIAMQALLGGHAAAAARIAALLTAFVFVGLFLSLASGLMVIWPRAGAATGTTLVYFVGISRRSEPGFVAAFLHQPRAEVIQNVLAGVHATARIVQQKFRWVSVSVASLLATLVLWTALEVLRVAVPKAPLNAPPVSQGQTPTRAARGVQPRRVSGCPRACAITATTTWPSIARAVAGMAFSNELRNALRRRTNLEFEGYCRAWNNNNRSGIRKISCSVWQGSNRRSSHAAGRG